MCPVSLQPEQPFQVLDRPDCLTLASPQHPLEVAHGEQGRGVIDNRLESLGRVRQLAETEHEGELVRSGRESSVKAFPASSRQDARTRNDKRETEHMFVHP